MISDQRLEEAIRMGAEDELLSASETAALAKELLALRKAFSNPVAYYGDGAYYNTLKSATKDGCEYIEPLYARPVPE